MGDGEGADLVAVERHCVPAAQLHELELVAQPPDHAGEDAEELAEARRPVDVERRLARPQRERLQHPGEPEVVVGVEVRQEDVLEVDEPDRRAQELALGSLAAVEAAAGRLPGGGAASSCRAAPWARSRTCRGRPRRGPSGDRNDRLLSRCYGRTSFWPGAISLPPRWFARWICQIAFRTSPP